MTSLSVTVLGCGDAFGSGGRLQTSFHVAAGDTRFLIDCGATVLPALRRAGLDPAALDAVIVSHLHGDHFGGLPFLEREAQLAGTRRRPLVVLGPPSLESRLAMAMEALFPGSRAAPGAHRLEVRAYSSAGPARLGPLLVTARPMAHTAGTEAHCLRVEVAGRAVAYSGDGEWSEDLVDMARGADLFLCEAYGLQRPCANHLDLATLRAHRHRLDCRRLVLTHLGPPVLSSPVGTEFEVAYDGMVIDC